jgi:hypothetical protein|tara:strand:+ start:3235 stop:3462 length:228 start_codon:yes stop_codon:yes gene_type:complete
MSNNEIKVGSLVHHLVACDWPKVVVDTESIGVVVSGPETFGFVDRCLVHWSGECPFPENPCWLNVEELEVVRKNA